MNLVETVHESILGMMKMASIKLRRKAKTLDLGRGREHIEITCHSSELCGEFVGLLLKPNIGVWASKS